MKLTSAVAAIIVTGSASFVAAPGLAALNDCANNTTCIWADNDYKGDRQGRVHGQGNITNVSDLLNNRMDSWANRSATYTSCGWDGKDGKNDDQTWNSVSNDNNVSPLSSDEVSSWRTKYGC